MRKLFAILGLVSVAACSGGSSSPPPTPTPTPVHTAQPSAEPTATSTPSPTPSPSPRASATATPSATPTVTPPPSASPLPTSGSYLPFDPGNTWIMSDGSAIADDGMTPIANTGLQGEEFDFYNASYDYLGNMQFIKAPWPNLGVNGAAITSDALTNLAEVSDGTGNFSLLIAPETFPYSSATISFPGLPIADDTPVVNETFTLNPATGAASACACGYTFPNMSFVSNINPAPTSQPYPYSGPYSYSGPIQTIDSIQNDDVIYPSTEHLTFINLAPGIGFTSIGSTGFLNSRLGIPLIYLNSFYNTNAAPTSVSRVHELSRRHKPTGLRMRPGNVSAGDILSRM